MSAPTAVNLTVTADAAFDLDHARGFLTALYAGRPGWVQIVGIVVRGRPKAWSQFETTPAGLAAAAAYAGELDALGLNVYWRVTTMNTAHPLNVAKTGPGRGGGDDTEAIPHLWADIDYGEEGHEPSASGRPNPPTAQDAYSLIAAAGLPEPTVLIHSGGGLYPIWTLAEPVPQDQAEKLSEGIQQVLGRAATARGWDYGEGVGDMPRILRLPGSVNRKTVNLRPCRAIPGGTLQLVPIAALPVVEPKQAPREVQAPRGERLVNASLAPEEEFLRGQYRNGSSGYGPFDALAELASWADVLEANSWTYVGRDSAGETWLRPGGATSEYSARVLDVEPHVLVVHSESAGLPSGKGKKNTKGRVYAHFWHGGDERAAAQEIATGGGGHLPEQVAAEIKRKLSEHTKLPSLDGQGTAAGSAQAGGEAGAGGLSTFLLPAEVWTSTPVLQHIYAAAVARLVSPDAVLHSVLAIMASLLHYESRVDTGNGQSVLSYYFAPIGKSGRGKSKALKTARELLKTWMGGRMLVIPKDKYTDTNLGSGEGMIEAYMGKTQIPARNLDGTPRINAKTGEPVYITVREQTKHNALFHCDEGRVALAAASRKGATLFGILCSMWSGSSSGQYNGDAERTRNLAEDSYVLGLLMGFQLTTISDLFADDNGGTPQRFTFAPASYAPFAENPDDETDYPWPGDLLPQVPSGPVLVTLAPEQRREVSRAARLMHGDDSNDNELDGHRMLLRARMAALLALLHRDRVTPTSGLASVGGAEIEISEEIWLLAKALTDRSCALRDWLAGIAERKAIAEAKRHDERQKRVQVAAATEIGEVQRIRDAADKLVTVVEKHDGGVTAGVARHTVRRYRDVIHKAEELAVADGRLVREKRPGSGKGGAREVDWLACPNDQ